MLRFQSFLSFNAEGIPRQMQEPSRDVSFCPRAIPQRLRAEMIYVERKFTNPETYSEPHQITRKISDLYQAEAYS